MKLTLVLASIYFGVVFAVGFVLGAIRITFLLPRLGERYAELIEMPVMLLVVFLTARWFVTRFSLIGKVTAPLMIGFIASGMLLAVEFSMVLWLRGLTLEQFFANRDPVAGTAYYLAVILFALAPLILAQATRNESTK